MNYSTQNVGRSVARRRPLHEIEPDTAKDKKNDVNVHVRSFHRAPERMRELKRRYMINESLLVVSKW